MAWKLSKFIKTAPSDHAANWISHAIQLRGALMRCFKTSGEISGIFMDMKILLSLANKCWMKSLFFIDLLMVEMTYEPHHISRLIYHFISN